MMRKLLKSARAAVSSYRATAIQVLGAGGVSWGLYDVRPWLGKAAGGLLLVLFGLAAERGGA
jgi:hypothetical protein